MALLGSENGFHWALELWEENVKGYEDGLPKKNRAAWREIVYAIDDDHLSYVQDIKNREEAWIKLENVHQNQGTTTLLRLLREWFTIELGSREMQDQLNDLKGRVRRWKGMDIDLPEAGIIAVALSSLLMEKRVGLQHQELNNLGWIFQ